MGRPPQKMQDLVATAYASPEWTYLVPEEPSLIGSLEEAAWLSGLP